MSANVELFVRVLAQIEREPQRWNQGRFARQTNCGTTYCFAGWACALKGFEADLNAYGWENDPSEVVTDRLTDGGYISEVAETLLGIDPLVGCDLFEPWNTLNDLYMLSARACGLDEQVLRDKVAAEVADGRTQQ